MIADTLRSHPRPGSNSLGALAFGGNNTSGPIDVASACNAHGGSGRMDFETETFVTHALRDDGFNASEGGTDYDPPPIPIRNFDWRAWREDADETSPVGFGRTREQAVARLLEKEAGCGH